MNDSKLLEIFPFIKNSVRLFDDQNRFLKKIILTGKICALEKAANLFSFTEKTIDTFRDLRDELIPLLIRENIKKYAEELHSKAQISIDILIRNLFERTADVGFLATDTEIISFLKGSVDIHTLRTRLVEYTLKYSVYDEIIVTDTHGKVMISMSTQVNGIISNDPIIKKALATNGYVEEYSYSDLTPTHSKSLRFAQKIVDGSLTIGVLILHFRFEDEMERIFKSLLNQGENIFFTDGKNIITSSSKESLPITQWNDNLEKDYILHNDFLLTPAKTNGYEGYYGAPWHSIAYVNIKKMTQKAPKQDALNQKCTLNQNIKSIIAKADDVIEDLSDVIINGELIASKERVYVLTPVLDNLRTISTSILDTIKETVNNLENTIMDGLIYEVKASAKLAIEIMDRNLYERANDCRWWALTPAFEDELNKDIPDNQKINDVINYINSLYTVYTNIFVYDRHSTIISTSNDLSITGKKISGEYISKALSNKNPQNYFVSNYETTSFYNHESTYIYSASIVKHGKILGGIGIVFDGKPQFEAMLNESFPHGKVGFSCFIDRKGVVISSTRADIAPMSKLEIDEDILRFNSKDSLHRFITFNDEHYLLGIALSQGYREYKIDDNYKNDILSLTFIEY